MAEDGFHCEHIRNVRFAGQVFLGKNGVKTTYSEELETVSGIQDALLTDCRIGDHVFIRQARIQGYQIEREVYIENVGELVMRKPSYFGNGEKIIVLNEGGGREVPMVDHLPAPLAYMMALYRHRPRFIAQCEKILETRAGKMHAATGYVGRGSHILHTGSIKEVWIGEAACIQNGLRLQNGSINSTPDGPVEVGAGTIAENFILEGGSRLTDGALLYNTYVGAASEISRQFSAENCLIFSNCSLWHGEACSAFAGPFTVSHHKNTLLIAGMFSFMNAGSGTNQSNHMYKLGPLHTGIMERGCKTGSDAYVLWPARIGPFSLISGRHYKHPDTALLPFSILLEEQGETICHPGLVLKNVGLVRDRQKWLSRDRRPASLKSKSLNLQLFNPATLYLLQTGYQRLSHLLETHAETKDKFSCQGVRIPVPAAKRGIHLYGQAIKACLLEIFLGAEKPEAPDREEQWLDLAGMTVTKSRLDAFLDAVEAGSYADFAALTGALEELAKTSEGGLTDLGEHICKQHFGSYFQEMSPGEKEAQLDDWLAARAELDQMRIRDAQKEFKDPFCVAYGIDGDEEVKAADFNAVRGDVKADKTLLQIQEEAAYWEKKRSAFKG